MVGALRIPCTSRIDRIPDIRFLSLRPRRKPREPRRHHSDDSRNHPVDPERLAKHIGVTVEPPPPEGAADDNGLELLLTFFRAKDSPQGALHSDQVEKVLSR